MILKSSDLGWGLKNKEIWGSLTVFSVRAPEGGQDRFFWAAELIEILTRLYRNAGWKRGSHTQSTTGQGYTGRRAAWLPAIWKEDKSNNKSKPKERGGKKKGETRDVQAGHKASDVLLFHWDWIRWNTFHRAPVSKFLSFTSFDVLALCSILRRRGMWEFWSM